MHTRTSSPSSALLLLVVVQGLAAVALVSATRPAPAKYYRHQAVDHVGSARSSDGDLGGFVGMEWTQRYYTWDIEFKGGGHPIFIIMGGEGHISPSVGLHYPFITDVLAKEFGAYVLQPEHRFYGESQPLEGKDLPDLDYDPRLELLTPEQAVLDALQLLDHIKEDLDCSDDRSSASYCPVITVGGSYPGFMAAFSRIMAPDQVDMAYAGSAPMKFYSQEVSAGAYYEHITNVVENMHAGCSGKIRNALETIRDDTLEKGMDPGSVGICQDSVPGYIATDQTFLDELFMVVAYSFANDNMAFYPPTKDTRLANACDIFSCCCKDANAKVAEFLTKRLGDGDDATCWNMTGQLPSGPGATISSGDWSGVGTGGDGESWDFQTCGILIEAIGFTQASMFPVRDWSLDWLTQHCQARFAVTPDPYVFVDQFRFDAKSMIQDGVTKILFTNGENDGWSVGGINETLSPDLPVINFPNGAHHSDLSGVGPSDVDTDDIKAGFVQIQAILSTWLDEIVDEAVEVL